MYSRRKNHKKRGYTKCLNSFKKEKKIKQEYLARNRKKLKDIAIPQSLELQSPPNKKRRKKENKLQSIVRNLTMLE